MEYYVYLSNKIGEYCIFVEVYIYLSHALLGAINCEAYEGDMRWRQQWMIEPDQKKVMSGCVCVYM